MVLRVRSEPRARRACKDLLVSKALLGIWVHRVQPVHRALWVQPVHRALPAMPVHRALPVLMELKVR
jgi:hypothetical protein